MLPDRPPLPGHRAPAAGGHARARRGARRRAAWAELPIALIDVETTGTDASVDRVVEVGIAIARGGEIVERRNWLVNPGRPIPKEASDVHKITDDDVKDAPPLRGGGRGDRGDARGLRPGGLQRRVRPRVPRQRIRPHARSRGGERAARRSGGTSSGSTPWCGRASSSRASARGRSARWPRASASRSRTPTGPATTPRRPSGCSSRSARDVRVPRTYAALVQEQRRLAMAQADERRLNKWR